MGWCFCKACEHRRSLAMADLISDITSMEDANLEIKQLIKQLGAKLEKASQDNDQLATALRVERDNNDRFLDQLTAISIEQRMSELVNNAAEKLKAAHLEAESEQEKLRQQIVDLEVLLVKANAVDNS